MWTTGISLSSKRDALFGMSLTRKFLLATALFFFVLVIAVGGWITRRIEESVLIRNAEFAAYYMNSFLEPNVQSLDEGLDLSAADYAALTQISADDALRRHVLAIKIWLPDGTVVFSTDKTIEGQKFDPQELARPLQGEIGAYLDALDAEENAHERSLDGPIYEVYIPLHSNKTGAIIAVGEFYEDAAVLKLQLQDAFSRSLEVLGAVSLLVFAALYVMVTKGTHTIDNQRAKLKSLGDAQEDLVRQSEAIAREVEVGKRNLVEIDRLFRRRVGLELHDGPSQLLTFVLLNLDEIADIDIKSGGANSQEVRAQIERTKQVAADALKEVRSISASLFAAQNEDLASAPIRLSDAVSQFEMRSGLKVQRKNLELTDQLLPSVRHSLGRVVIEGLNNSFWHSGATEISVEIARTDAHLSVTISDNGNGELSEDAVAATANDGRMGLPGMRLRIESLGGSLTIKSNPGKSTTLQIQIPLYT